VDWIPFLRDNSDFKVLISLFDNSLIKTRAMVLKTKLYKTSSFLY